jgi:DNA-binding transcriptional regulator YiaG
MPTLLMSLKRLREKAGLKPEEAAYKLGIALSTLRNWEAGKHQPTMNPDQFAKALEVYGCTFEEFRQAAKDTVKGNDQ